MTRGSNAFSPHQWICRSRIFLFFLLFATHSVKAEVINQPKIVIVGAGASGIAAATRLIENGFTNIKILEAENRIGGRVYSLKTGNWTVDIGGHWVHGESGNVVYEIAGPLGLLDTKPKDFTNEITAFSDKTVQGTLLFSLLETVKNNLPKSNPTGTSSNASLYDVMLERLTSKAKNFMNNTEKVDAYLKWLLDIECRVEGCDSLKDVANEEYDDYEDAVGAPIITWKGKGFKSIIDLLLKRHEKSQGPPIDLEGKLHLNTEVTSVTQGNDGIQVQCKDGSIFPADLVIVTVSLAVLKDRHATLFQPPLPEYKKKAIESIGIGTIDKIILRFPHTWWPEDITGFETVWLEKHKPQKEGEIPWEYGILAFSAEDGSPFTLTGWIIGKDARAMEADTIENVKEKAMKILRKFLGHKYSIPEPVEVLRSKWGTNPNFRGAYSYRSVASKALNVTAADLAKPLTDDSNKEVILFAGEATNSKHHSTVHGAIESGWREADRIIKAFKS